MFTEEVFPNCRQVCLSKHTQTLQSVDECRPAKAYVLKGSLAPQLVVLTYQEVTRS